MAHTLLDNSNRHRNACNLPKAVRGLLQQLQRLQLELGRRRVHRIRQCRHHETTVGAQKSLTGLATMSGKERAIPIKWYVQYPRRADGKYS